MKLDTVWIAPLALLLAPAWAQAEDAATAAQPAPMAFEDVEELNDAIGGLDGQRVVVEGEIEEHLDGASFVLESGGIFNDEITVIAPATEGGLQPQLLSEDADVVVTGTIRRIPAIEIERELGWDFDSEIEAELEEVQTFLVAETVAHQ